MKPLLMHSWFFTVSLTLFGVTLLLFMFFGSLLFIFLGVGVVTVLFSERVKKLSKKFEEIDNGSGRKN